MQTHFGRTGTLNLSFKGENKHKQFSISDCDIDNLSNLTEYVESNKLQTITSNNSFKNTFTVLSLNIRSIVNSFNFSKLEALLSNMNCKPDVISLSKTWIQPLSSGPYKNLNGYNFVSNCRNSCKGGGVAFYVKDKVYFNICDELGEMDEKIFESLCINLKMEGESFLCGTIYRSPANDARSNDKFRVKLKNCFGKIDVKEKYYIFGDFKYDLAQTSENAL